MTARPTVKVSCQLCGDVEMSLRDVRLFLPRPGEQGPPFALYRCLRCGCPGVAWPGQDTVSKMLGRVTTCAIVREAHCGVDLPPFNLADVTEWSYLLDALRTPADLEAWV